MTRDEIITALEAATGPDRELDAEIWCAINGHEVTWNDNRMIAAGVPYVIGSIDPGRKQRNFTLWPDSEREVLAFTGSVDAMLTLAGERWEEVLTIAFLLMSEEGVRDVHDLPRFGCIAALRAHAET